MILLRSDPECLQTVSKALNEGQIVIIPTDTVYGFSGIVPKTDALIRKIKGREEIKPFIQLIASPSDIRKYSPTQIPDKILKHMPGPITVIVKNNDNDGTTAFRCPNDEWLQKLLALCNAPLYSTSTNRSGEEILFDVHEMEREFENEIFCIVDAGSSISLNNTPSTIVNLSTNEIHIVRQGSLQI